MWYYKDNFINLVTISKDSIGDLYSYQDYYDRGIGFRRDEIIDFLHICKLCNERYTLDLFKKVINSNINILCPY